MAFVLAGTAVSAATAGQILVSPIGGGVVLTPGPLSATTLGITPTAWSSASLSSVHASINASGIDTNGKITFLAADTDQGLAMMVLVDQQMLLEGVSASGSVYMDSVASGSSTAFIKDSGGVSVTANGPNSRTASGAFGWNSNQGGSGFAWAGLSNGDSMTFRFNRIVATQLGLDDPNTFQFVTWVNSGWQTIVVPAGSLSFTQTNDFGFAASVVPSPAGLAVAGFALLAPACVRRRRNG